MRQSIEKQQEANSAQNPVTVMFHDRRGLLGVVGVRVPENAVSTLPDALAVGRPVVSSILSLPRILKVSSARALSRHRTRRRTSPKIEKFSAEGPMARSALTVMAVIPNNCGAQAAANETTTMTEQRRCAAA